MVRTGHSDPAVSDSSGSHRNRSTAGVFTENDPVAESSKDKLRQATRDRLQSAMDQIHRFKLAAVKQQPLQPIDP